MNPSEKSFIRRGNKVSVLYTPGRFDLRFWRFTAIAIFCVIVGMILIIPDTNIHALTPTPSPTLHALIPTPTSALQYIRPTPGNIVLTTPVASLNLSALDAGDMADKAIQFYRYGTKDHLFDFIGSAMLLVATLALLVKLIASNTRPIS